MTHGIVRPGQTSPVPDPGDPITNLDVLAVYVPGGPNPTGNTVQVSGAANAPVAYHHVQGMSSTEWVIHHGLGFFPNVTTMDSGGSTVEGELDHTSAYELRVTFAAPISGDAYLS